MSTGVSFIRTMAFQWKWKWKTGLAGLDDPGDPEIHQVDFGRVHDFGHRLMNDVVPGFEIMLL
jgi:hypothetical protein